MSDIVDKLRMIPASTTIPLPEKPRWNLMVGAICKEASETIESLRAEQREMADNLTAIQNIHDAQKARLYAENAALREYAERLREALTEIADDSAHAVAQDALALPMPWDAIRKSEG